MPFAVPISSSSSGGTLTSYNDKHTKALANNTTTGLFTFPLSAGSLATLFIFMDCIAKKGTDWATGNNYVILMIYNASGTLHTRNGSIGGDNDNNAGAVSLVAFGGSVFTATISGGVVTVLANPGNVGVSPDSISCNFVVINPEGTTLTYL